MLRRLLHVGFLLTHHGRALTVMRAERQHSTAAADMTFCAKVDRRRVEQMKTLLLVYAAGRPEWLAKIEAARTVTDLQRVFIEIVDENVAASTCHVPAVDRGNRATTSG